MSPLLIGLMVVVAGAAGLDLRRRSRLARRAGRQGAAAGAETPAPRVPRSRDADFDPRVRIQGLDEQADQIGRQARAGIATSTDGLYHAIAERIRIRTSRLAANIGATMPAVVQLAGQRNTAVRRHSDAAEDLVEHQREERIPQRVGLRLGGPVVHYLLIGGILIAEALISRDSFAALSLTAAWMGIAIALLAALLLGVAVESLGRSIVTVADPDAPKRRPIVHVIALISTLAFATVLVLILAIGDAREDNAAFIASQRQEIPLNLPTGGSPTGNLIRPQPAPTAPTRIQAAGRGGASLDVKADEAAPPVAARLRAGKLVVTLQATTAGRATVTLRRGGASGRRLASTKVTVAAPGTVEAMMPIDEKALQRDIRDRDTTYGLDVQMASNPSGQPSAQAPSAYPGTTPPSSGASTGALPTGTDPQGALPTGADPPSELPTGANPSGGLPTEPDPQGTPPTGSGQSQVPPAGTDPQTGAGTAPAGSDPLTIPPSTLDGGPKPNLEFAIWLQVLGFMVGLLLAIAHVRDHAHMRWTERRRRLRLRAWWAEREATTAERELARSQEEISRAQMVIRSIAEEELQRGQRLEEAALVTAEDRRDNIEHVDWPDVQEVLDDVLFHEAVLPGVPYGAVMGQDPTPEMDDPSTPNDGPTQTRSGRPTFTEPGRPPPEPPDPTPQADEPPPHSGEPQTEQRVPGPPPGTGPAPEPGTGPGHASDSADDGSSIEEIMRQAQRALRHDQRLGRDRSIARAEPHRETVPPSPDGDPFDGPPTDT